MWNALRSRVTGGGDGEGVSRRRVLGRMVTGREAGSAGADAGAIREDVCNGLLTADLEDGRMSWSRLRWASRECAGRDQKKEGT